MLYLFVSILIALSVIGVWAYHLKQRKQLLERRFNQIIGLRQLIHLLRFHRRQSHQRLCESSAEHPQSMLAESMAIQALIRTLLSQAEQNHKPMYRILMKRVSRLLDEWPGYSIQRNQTLHGKTIRHVLYLIDDTITQSLISADKDEVFRQYQSVWPVTLNAIDSLSRFRYTIHNYACDSETMQRELNLHLQILQRRLKQIALPYSEVIEPQILEELNEQFEAIDLDHPDEFKIKDELYVFSLQVSDVLFQFFDNVLSQIGGEISIKMPELRMHELQEEKKVIHLLTR
ncbi:hypothetical protein C9I98_17175 [Photobacterium sanctipauli]|uniref:Uncharacterized protein n=1 Tax=Photobacterium sanctipauli TaxID=1342794 RepID=A0A2T3NQD0_9GAMM|nr:hypothetical protein [Photobacterium sanctipauli]PSW18432.1 hypothetical protein C9I98_17175 [Photobacterium sanctipauli]